MKLEEFKKMPLEEQLQTVNGARGKTKEFEKSTGCEFSYSQASAVLLSKGCRMVGSASWVPPMITQEELLEEREFRKEVLEFMKSHQKSSDAVILLRPITESRHTSIRINEKTAQRFDKLCKKKAVYSSAVLMDAAINYFIDVLESGRAILEAEGRGEENEEEENKE